MKILITVFEIQDYGGIIGHTENLARGLMEHGHQVDMVILRNSDQPPYYRTVLPKKGSYPSVFGGYVHALAGWHNACVMGYGTTRIIEWWRFANGYDLILHEIPAPKEEKGWKDIYYVDPPQIILAHDAHFRDMYPHIREIAHKITAITCTNHAGYKALEWCPIPRAFIGSSHVLDDWFHQPRWEFRFTRSVSAHVWKAWKHMDKIVRTAPHLRRSDLTFGGDGIEGRYMRSIEKCKPKYKGIWKEAMRTATWVGVLSAEELRNLYLHSRVMVDMSYSKKFAALGNHFNRSILEAANMGCVSICTTENMRENNPQVKLFEDGETHIGVPKDISPFDLAAVMDEVCNMDYRKANGIVANVRKILLDHFDYRKTCLQYLDLAKGLPAGVYPILETGKWPLTQSAATGAIEQGTL